jgi:ATP synthase I chain
MKKTTVKKLETNSFEIVIGGSVATLLAFAIIGYVTISLEFALGALVGGVVALLNHIGLYRSLKGLLMAASESAVNNPDDGKQFKSGILFTIFGFHFRIFLSGVIIFFALTGGWANPIAIFVGASVVMINSFIIGMLFYKID